MGKLVPSRSPTGSGSVTDECPVGIYYSVNRLVVASVLKDHRSDVANSEEYWRCQLEDAHIAIEAYLKAIKSGEQPISVVYPSSPSLLNTTWCVGSAVSYPDFVSDECCHWLSQI